MIKQTLPITITINIYYSVNHSKFLHNKLEDQI